MNAHDEIKKLMNEGFSVIPIPHKSKKATIKGWPDLIVTEDNFLDYFPSEREMNVGVLNGAKSGNIVDIDIDDPDALELSRHYLPETGMIFGRPSKPRSHWIYKCDTLPKTQRFDSKAHGNIIEIRSTGSQTVFPPSTHESGEEIRFSAFDSPAVVSELTLQEACKVIFVGTVLIKSYPDKGSRNDFALSMCNIALRLFDSDIEKARRFVKLVAKIACDEEAEQRADIVKHTADRMKAGESTKGIPSLIEFVGEDAARDIAKFIVGDTRDGHTDVVDEINKIYAFVTIPPNTAIIKEVIDEHGKVTFNLLNINAFKAEIAPWSVGNNQASTMWLRSPRRRQYDGLEFKPQNPSKNKYNLFRGYPIAPKEGDCSLVLDHVLQVVCSGNHSYYEYFMAWFANIIQQPENKPGTCIVLRGEQGVGKSIIIRMFGALLGCHFKIANNDRYLAGQFNAHFQECLLFNAEEAFFAGNKALESALKDIITGEKIFVEYKGREAIEIDNYMRVIISTNEQWAIPAGSKERRFFVLDVNDSQIQNHDYFAKLVHQYDHGGQAALMHHLLNFDYSHVNLRNAPKTEALLEQKLNSLRAEDKWWLDILTTGVLPEQNGWSGSCGTDAMFQSYLRHAHLSGVKYRSIATRIGHYLKQAVPNISKVDGSYVRSSEFGSDRVSGNYYTLPSLAECRRAFETRIGQEIKWD